MSNPYNDGNKNNEESKEHFKITMYRDLPGFPVETLNDCKTWWDVVVWRYFGELASVTFLVENQEETSGYDPLIQRAWVKVALSDYKTEFQKVYDFLTFLDG